MKNDVKDEYDFFKGKHEKNHGEPITKEWIRAKEGEKIYSMGRTKLVSLAREAGAVYKINSTLLINVAKFESYLETFRVPGI